VAKKKNLKYLVTVDPDSRAVTKVEHLGDAGELTQVPASTLGLGAPAASIAQGANVIHIYMGGGGGPAAPALAAPAYPDLDFHPPPARYDEPPATGSAKKKKK